MPETTTEVGFVVQINNYLIKLDGLPTVRVNDIIKNEQGVRAWVKTLHSDVVDAYLLDEGDIKPGQMFIRSEPLSVNIGEYLLGRAINPLGVAIDGKGPLLRSVNKNYYQIDKPAPGIKTREFIRQQLETGITLIDLLLPIGKGQRELILGDARAGKTSFVIDLILNQKKNGVICIYASIGKPIIEIRNIIDVLTANQGISYTAIIAASSSDLAPLLFLVPQTAFSIGEYFQKKGLDVLIILDDLGNHAKIYREMSLLANFIPGRESYPGDIFYQHAHLLERAGNFQRELGGGSITAIPIIENNLTDITTFIPTNLMAATDGHLMFQSSIYNQGQRPGINIFQSVSRVGSQTQNIIQKSVSLKLKSILIQAEQLKTLSSFSGELSVETQYLQKKSRIILELLNQPSLAYIPKDVQVVLVSLVFTPFFDNKDEDFVSKNKERIIEALLNINSLRQYCKKGFEVKNEDEFYRNLNMIIPTLEKICRQQNR